MIKLVKVEDRSMLKIGYTVGAECCYDPYLPSDCYKAEGGSIWTSGLDCFQTFLLNQGMIALLPELKLVTMGIYFVVYEDVDLGEKVSDYLYYLN